MHRVLVKNEDFEISWIAGCQCLLAAIRSPTIGREGIDCFFRELKDARNNMQAGSLALDLRNAGRLPSDIWDWLGDTWYPVMVAQGLKCQAIIRSNDLATRIQWRNLAVAGLICAEFEKLPIAIHWLGKADTDTTPTRRRLAIASV